MGCPDCDQPKCSGNPSPRVLEIINNKENTTIFHKVPYPASLGVPTDEEIKGMQYSNVLLVIEANDDAWLFSSDGVATLLTKGDWKLLQDRVDQFDETVQETVGKVDELDHQVQEVNEFVQAESTALREITGNLQRNLEQETADRTEAINELQAKVEGDIGNAISELQSDVAEETTAREEADNNLQTQIDAINDKSDVVDVVGTKAELDSYDTSSLGDNDIVKVLNDETHDDAITYYRWDKTDSQWEYVGETGPYYTKAEVDEKIQDAENPRAKNLPVRVVGSTLPDLDYVVTINQNSANSLGFTYTGVALDTGSGATSNKTLPAATQEYAGVMTAADKKKLDSIPEGGGGSDVQILNEYTAETEPTNVYSAEYINSRLNSNTVRIGSGTAITGTTGAPRAVLIGNNATTVHGNSVVIGGEAHAYSTTFASVVIGDSARGTTGDNGRDVIIGPSARGGSGVKTVVIGADANTNTYSGTVVLGSEAKANRNYEVSVGDPNNSDSNFRARYLANVRAGELDTDAVNKKQMEDYVAEYGGGGGSVTLAEEYGDSSTTALSQKFISNKLNGKQVLLGNGAAASGDGGSGSVAIGNNSRVQGVLSVAIGGNAQTTNDYTTAVGNGSQARGSRSMAIGMSAETSLASNHNIAIGANSTSSHTHSVALGAYSKTSRASEVSIGDGSENADRGTRFLANVRNGVNPQDAVTVNQLNTAIGDVEAILARLSDGAGV